MPAPKGNKNAVKGAALSKRLQARLEERKLWDDMADALLEKALTGDIAAIKEVFDRIDGKAKQAIDIGGQEDNPLNSNISISFVPVENED
jgi:hypothetical protein